MYDIDPSRSEPLFQQIVAAVKRDVATGRLRPGDRLPTVRESALDLVVNPNTIAKAYRVLEAEGVTVSRRGAGTFIAPHRPTTSRRERVRAFREALDEALADAVHRGLTRAEAERAIESALKRFRFGSEEKP